MGERGLRWYKREGRRKREWWRVERQEMRGRAWAEGTMRKWEEGRENGGERKDRE